MMLFNNLKSFLNLSIISLIFSFFLLNILPLFFSLDLSLKLVLILLFLFNFFRLKKIFLIRNTYKFFIFFFLLIAISRLVEYKFLIFFTQLSMKKMFRG